MRRLFFFVEAPWMKSVIESGGASNPRRFSARGIGRPRWLRGAERFHLEHSIYFARATHF
jgi:hypothetical protein